MITQQPAQSQSQPQVDGSYVDNYQPPTSSVSTQSTTPVVPPTDKKNESLQDQNVFYLLGVEKGSDEDKEAFLDELQQVIWEDFIETDVKKLISVEEMTQLRYIMAKGDNQEVQEEMVVYLEKLIPDLEKIMLEKALELKADLFWERISAMREYYADKPELIIKVDEAEQLAKKDRWQRAAEILNATNAAGE